MCRMREGLARIFVAECNFSQLVENQSIYSSEARQTLAVQQSSEYIHLSVHLMHLQCKLCCQDHRNVAIQQYLIGLLNQKSKRWWDYDMPVKQKDQLSETSPTLRVFYSEEVCHYQSDVVQIHEDCQSYNEGYFCSFIQFGDVIGWVQIRHYSSRRSNPVRGVVVDGELHHLKEVEDLEDDLKVGEGQSIVGRVQREERKDFIADSLLLSRRTVAVLFGLHFLNFQGYLGFQSSKRKQIESMPQEEQLATLNLQNSRLLSKKTNEDKCRLFIQDWFLQADSDLLIKLGKDSFQIVDKQMKSQNHPSGKSLSQQLGPNPTNPTYNNSEVRPTGAADIPLTLKNRNKKKEALSNSSKIGEINGSILLNNKEIKEQPMKQTIILPLDVKKSNESEFDIPKTVTKQEFYSGNRPSSDLFCPCGQKMSGPLAYFQHIKTNHSSDELQPLLKRQEISNFIKKYPNNQPHQFQIIESFDDNNFYSQIHKMTTQYSIDSFKCSDKVPMPQLKGTYADLEFKIVQQFGKNKQQRLLLVQFFQCVKHFIVRRFNQQYWQQESPKDILKMSNHMYHYFRAAQRLVGHGFGPLKIQHLMKLLYILGRWMFINKWTNDRLIRLQPQTQEFQSIQEVKEIVKGKEVSRQKNKQKCSKNVGGYKGVMVKGKK